MIPTEDIMDLLKLCLASTYFHYNDNHYKQLHGTAMESPVSVVVAEIVMQNIEKRGLYTCRQTIRYTTLTRNLPPYDTPKSTHFTTTIMDTTLTYSLTERSKKMVKNLF